MLPPVRQSCLRRGPSPRCICLFSTSPQRPSRIGKLPVIVPDTVTLTPVPPPKSRNPREAPLGSLLIKGPLGELSLGIPPFLSIREEPIPSSTSRRVSVSVKDPKIRQQREMWGTSRSNLQQMVLGVTEGHSVIMRLVGVGYKAMVEKEGRLLSMKLGFSHTIDMEVPEGVKCTVPAPTRILLEGCHKTHVRQFAASVREWRIPEPYKGKGIFINDETIKLKVKKVK